MLINFWVLVLDQFLELEKRDEREREKKRRAIEEKASRTI